MNNSLFSREISKNATPLVMAIVNGQFEIVRVLANGGADTNAMAYGEMYPLHFASWPGNDPAIPYLVVSYVVSWYFL